MGLALSVLEPWQAVSVRALVFCAGSALALSAAYVLVVHAMRHGEISSVAPFRYVVLIWAIVIQITVFAVWPDALTLLGSAILVATGLYTVYRERKLRGPAIMLAPKAVSPPA
jgi:S-adenosylmethionine uptake transporter